MPFSIPSLGQVISDLVADFQNRFPSANVSRLSGHWKRLAVFAGGIASLHRHQQVVARDVMPDTATGAQLDRHGAIYGAARRAATAAQRTDALRLTGTVASTFTLGDQLTTTDGLIFKLNESGSIPAAGFVDVSVIAVSTGVATRKSAGTTMTFLSPPAGITGTAVLQLDMNEGGVDQEADGLYRVRILDLIAQPGMGGNANDYRQWAKELAGIEEAYVWPLRGGLGSVHLAALHAGSGPTDRSLTSGEITALQDYIDARRPVSVANFLVLSTLGIVIDVEVLVEPEDDAAYAFDWNDQTPLVVSTWTAATRTLKFTAARPADMAVGDRIVYKRLTATKNSGEEHVIEGFGAAADEVVLRATTELTASPPVATNSVYSGGPLVAPVYAAIAGHIDALGPARPDTASPTQDYSSGSSYWEGTLRVAKLSNLAQKQAGVLDTTVVTPAANATPYNEAPDSSVGYYYRRQVIIRRKW